MGKVSRQDLLAAGVLAGFSLLSAWAGYFVMFSGFLPLDDEGYLMITRRYFLRGFALYDNVYTQYGPAYYFLRAAISPVVAETHDQGRLFSLALWILTALLVAVYTYRVTRSVPLAAFAQLVSFRLLSVFANEPGHPQELCALILALPLVLNLDGDVWPLLGVLAGLLFLIKINVGVLFLISIGMLLPGPLRYVSMAAATLLPVILMRHSLSPDHELQYVVVATISILAVCVALIRRKDRPQISPRNALLGLGGFVITVIAICGATLWRGTSLKGLLNGVILQSLTFGDRFEYPLKFKAGVIPAALIALVLAFPLRRSSKAIAVMKIGFCVVVAFLAIKGRALSLLGLGRGDLIILFAAPYLWLGIASGEFQQAFVCSVASLQILQAYPISGSQVAIGSFLFVPIAVTGFAEGVRELWPVERSIWQTYRTAVALALMGALGLAWGLTTKGIYASHVSLNLPGATRLRLRPEQTQTYTLLVERFTSSCDGFVTWPGINSLYFWTGKEPPTHVNTTEWARLLNEDQQREIVRKFSMYSRPCALMRNDEPLQNDSRLPLVAYLANHFHGVEWIGDYVRMMPN